MDKAETPKRSVNGEHVVDTEQADESRTPFPPNGFQLPQSVIGIGTDIIECDRIGQMLQKHGDTFLQRVFTPEEISYCSRHQIPDQHYAGRWAAKEAVLKVLGTGWAKGIQWTDVEVVRDAAGAPSILLHNRAAEIAEERHIRCVLISISHCKAFATAFAVGIP